MNELAGDAHISFEGDLKGLRLLTIPGVSQEPTMALKRSTLWPKQDFVIAPLEPSLVEEIITVVGGTLPKAVVHIQIEKNGVLEFGAYDNFHPECIFFGSAVKQSMMEWLISESIMRPFTAAR